MTARRWPTVVVTAALALLMGAAGSSRAAIVRLPEGFEPTAAAVGAAGSVWFAGGGLSGTPGIAQVDAAGAVRSFPSSGGPIVGLTATADGTAWFTDATSAIGRITPTGDVGHLETHIALERRQTFGAVAAGAPGHVWFDAGAGRIGELAADGSLLQVLAPPPGETTRRLVAADAADGLWVVRTGGLVDTSLSRLAPDGSVVFQVDLPKYVSGAEARALAPDGSLWLATGVDLTRVTLAGHVSVVKVTGTSGDGIRSLAFDGAGTLWFSTWSGESYMWSGEPFVFLPAPAQIGSLDAAGVLTLYPQFLEPAVVAIASDGVLWSASRTTTGAVARRTPPPPPVACVVPDVYGETLAAARSAIVDTTCIAATVRGRPDGVVWGVSPIPDTVLAPGGRVSLQLGSGRAPVTGTWRGLITAVQCNKNGGTTPSGENESATLRVARGSSGRLVATMDGRRLFLRRHRGTTYRFVSANGGSTLSLRQRGPHASIVFSEGSEGCGEVATTGALARTAAR